MIILYIISALLCFISLLSNLYYTKPPVSNGFALMWTILSLVPFVNTLMVIMLICTIFVLVKRDRRG